MVGLLERVWGGVFFLLPEGGVWRKVPESLACRPLWAHPPPQRHTFPLSHQPTLQFHKYDHFWSLVSPQMSHNVGMAPHLAQLPKYLVSK